jgi:folate-dependent phosphoribosylglycinamide formyltransferase PurN
MKILLLSPYGEAIASAIKANGDRVDLCTDILDNVQILARKPDWIISYGYRQLLRQPVLDALPGRVINLHISLLPWGRGADPNFWSWFEGSPKGVSIHQIDSGMDSGPLLAQRQLCFDPFSETLASSYQRLRTEIEDLFVEAWPDIAAGHIRPRTQRSLSKARRAREKADIFDDLPRGWGIRACIVDRLRHVDASRWDELTENQACPCPLGPCAIARPDPN